LASPSSLPLDSSGLDLSFYAFTILRLYAVTPLCLYAVTPFSIIFIFQLSTQSMDPLQEYAASLSTEFKYHANHNQNNNQVIVNAGGLSMIYENGNIRRIRSGNSEILRMIYPSVRGKGWLTYYPIITEEKFEVKSDSFKIYYDCLYKSGEINFSAHFSIEGFSDSSVIFSMDGEANSDFEKNRIGFCVLHSAEYGGISCKIGHSNGEEEVMTFPRLISPRQPFTDINKMIWEKGGNNFSLDLYGDVFETEDQRNWTDASYKTYCTPLGMPYPVKIKTGDKISQKVVFKMNGTSLSGKNENTGITINVFPENISPLPMIGIARSSRPQEITGNEIKIIQKLNFDHYRTDLHLFNVKWKDTAALAATEAKKIGCPLELAVFIDDNFHEQVTGLLAWIVETKPMIAAMHIFHKDHRSTPAPLINEIGSIIKEVLPAIKAGAGTNANFAQVNRDRPSSTYIDNVSYSIHPQEHAGDNLTLVENLQAQASTVESAMNFSGGRGIWVSPVNIQRRFNANTENFEQPAVNDSCPPQIDSRLLSLFGACWVAGSIKYICESGAQGVTYLETVGERGIFQGDFASRWPQEFPSKKGMFFPVYYVFQFIAGCKSYNVIKTESSETLAVESLMLSDGNDIKMILLNFTAADQNVTLGSVYQGARFQIKQLNSETFDKAVSDKDWFETTLPDIKKSNEKLILKPFSISFIDRSVNL
jgi:hypothetical protein